MKNEVIIRQCSHIGVAGTTPVHVKKHSEKRYEARCGFALMGSTNMDQTGFEACNYDPFNEKFHDNYAVGFGVSEEAACIALKADMQDTANSIWAF